MSTTTPRLDNYGHDYDDLVSIQTKHIEGWKKQIKPEVLTSVAKYVRSQNKCAGRKQTHQVFRGQDLIELIRVWPSIPEGFPVPETEDII